MKVAMYYNNKDIRIQEIEKPKAGQNEIVVRVMSCGICGSDVAEWYRMKNAPLVAGHEAAGEIAEVGKDVKGFKVGERVFVAPKAPCMKCEYCKLGKFPLCANVTRYAPGGFAEFILVPEGHIANGVFRLPKTMSYDRATFIEPLGCVIRAQKLAGVSKGQTVLVLGSGISGILHIRYAKSKGAKVIAADISKERLDFAERSGAVAMNADDKMPEKIISVNGKKADIAIISTGSLSAVGQAWKCVDKGACVVFFAVPSEKEIRVPLNDFWRKEMRVITSYYCGPSEMKEALKLIESGEIAVEDLITHNLPLEETQKGFNLVLDGKNSLKVIVHPQQ